MDLPAAALANQGELVAGGAVSQTLDDLDCGPVAIYSRVTHALDLDVASHDCGGLYYLEEVVETLALVGLLRVHEPRFPGAAAIDSF